MNKWVELSNISTDNLPIQPLSKSFDSLCIALVIHDNVFNIQFGKGLDKDPNIRCGKWNKVPLSKKQREYAAMDSIAGLLCFEKLKSLNPTEEIVYGCMEDILAQRKLRKEKEEQRYSFIDLMTQGKSNLY